MCNITISGKLEFLSREPHNFYFYKESVKIRNQMMVSSIFPQFSLLWLIVLKEQMHPLAVSVELLHLASSLKSSWISNWKAVLK